MRDRTFWLVLFYVFAALLAVGILLVCNTDFKDYCPKDESPALCLREWIGAAGGYIATVFAAITIFFLYRQIVEQRRQTEFTLGDANPTMDVTQDLEDPEDIVVRIVNWNRRGVILNGLDPLGIQDDARIKIIELKIDGQNWDFDRHSGYPYLRGWEDRQSSPHIAQYKLTGFDPHPFFVWPEDTEVIAYVQLIDDNHRNLLLRASLFPREKTAYVTRRDQDGWLISVGQ